MSTIDFIKMHGLGNDFVIVDARSEPFEVTPSLSMLMRHVLLLDDAGYNPALKRLSTLEEGVANAAAA